MSMAIMPAFVLSTVSILVNLTLGVVGALAGDNLLVAFESVGQMLLNMYLTLLVLGGITTVTEWNQIRTSSVKKFVYVFTFPLFMFTYIPILWRLSSASPSGSPSSTGSPQRICGAVTGRRSCPSESIWCGGG